MAGQDGAPNSTGADETSLRDELAAELGKGEPDAGAEGAEPIAPDAEPVAAPVVDASGRVRDPVTKRFVAKETPPVEGQQPPAQQPVVAPQEPPPGQALMPPPGFSPTAKAEWAKVPPSVQQAIAKREQEVDKGFKKYAGLDQYVQMAQQSGTNLPEALQRYVAAEQLLEKDPISGIRWLCKNYNIDPRQLIGPGQQPAQQPQPNGQQPQPGQQPYPGFDFRQQLDPIVKQVNDLTQMITGEQQNKVLGEVDSFFKDTKSHPYVENVAEDMARLLQAGVFKTLQEAYDAACWNNEEVRGLLINDITTARTADQAAKAKATANQARAAGQSITGGPQATPPPGTPQADDLRGQLKDAFQAQRVT